MTLSSFAAGAISAFLTGMVAFVFGFETCMRVSLGVVMFASSMLVVLEELEWRRETRWR
jgi:hypothetical protein